MTLKHHSTKHIQNTQQDCILILLLHSSFYGGSKSVFREANCIWDHFQFLCHLGSHIPSSRLVIQEKGAACGQSQVYKWGWRKELLTWNLASMSLYSSLEMFSWLISFISFSTLLIQSDIPWTLSQQNPKDLASRNCCNLKQNEACSTCVESTKGINSAPQTRDTTTETWITYSNSHLACE